mgnify:CR=1 FL=1
MCFRPLSGKACFQRIRVQLEHSVILMSGDFLLLLLSLFTSTTTANREKVLRADMPLVSDAFFHSLASSGITPALQSFSLCSEWSGSISIYVWVCGFGCFLLQVTCL